MCYLAGKGPLTIYASGLRRRGEGWAFGKPYYWVNKVRPCELNSRVLHIHNIISLSLKSWVA